MPRNKFRDGITAGGCFEVLSGEPVRFEKRLQTGDFFFCGWTVVQVRRVASTVHLALFVNRNEVHFLRNHLAFAATCDARVMNTLLQVKQGTHICAGIGGIHQHRTTSEDITVALQDEIDGIA